MSKYAAPIHWPAALAVAALLTGCTATASGDGPLTVGADSSSICAVQPEHGLAAYGNVVQNEGESALIITKVTLVEAESLEIRSAHIMPIAGLSPYVLGTGSTEPEEPEARTAWKSAKEVEAYKIDAGDSVNVIVALDNGDSASGTSRALRIDYKHGGDSFFVETNMSLSLADESCA